MRTALKTALVLTMALGPLVGVTGSAQAASWVNDERRIPYDGDPGGVSGWIEREWSANRDYFAKVDFKAKGERFKLINHTTAPVTYWVKAGSKMYVNGYALAPMDDSVMNYEIREGEDVVIKLCIQNRGCNTLGTLKT